MRRTPIGFLVFLASAATPVLAQSRAPQSTFLPPAASRGGFGGALAIGEGEVLVGEPSNSFRSGRVYVYRKVGPAWRQAAILTAPDSQVSDHFGSALALAGNDLFIGQERAGGKIHHFRKEGASWKSDGVITAADVSESDGFGTPMVASGDWLLVGAPQQTVTVNGVGERSGSVYAFHRGSDGRWGPAGKIPVPSPTANDLIGLSIAIDHSRLLVGAPGKNQRTGAVYVFQLDSAGAWREAGQIQRPNLQRNELFGYTVRLHGDSAYVGQPFQDAGYGALFVFRWNAQRSQWLEQGRFTGGGRRGDRFSSSVETDGRSIWAGAPNAPPSGRVYVYATDTTQPAVRVLALPEADAQLGQQIAVRDNLAAITAAGADLGDGNVIIYERDKTGQWQQASRLTTTVDALEPMTAGERRCDAQGKVARFDCKGADLRSFLPVTKLTVGRTSHLSGIWGWTDPTNGKEYALVGRTDGTAFVDISDAAHPVFIGELPKTENTTRNFWREIKTYQNYAFIVSEGAGHGMQIFDLTQLRAAGRPARPGAAPGPVIFKPTLTYDRVSSSHNIVINEESGFAYITGAGGAGDNCGGALHIVDIHDPRNPKFAGCFADSTTGLRLNGYVHDAQCVNYRGPDQRYRGHEVCVTANENMIDIVDMTDKTKPRVIAKGQYANASYAHQGWFTDDQRYWFMDDELDEEGGKVQKTRTLIWDLADLEKPAATEFYGTTGATDHNLFIKGNLMYQSNYQAGLRIVDITDPTHPNEIGYFDTAPYEDNVPGFEGTWSNYPFFKSGTIAVVSGNEGLFLLKKSETLTP